MAHFDPPSLMQRLRETLPAALHPQIGTLVQLIERASAGGAPGQTLDARDDLAIRPVLTALQGREVESRGALITFGQSGNLGDVTIRDVARGAVTTVTIGVQHCGEAGAKPGVRALADGVRRAHLLDGELYALACTLQRFGERARGLLRAAPTGDRRLLSAAARGLLSGLADDLRASSLALSAARHEHGDWLWSAQRTFEPLLLPAGSTPQASRADLKELLRQVAALSQATAEMRQALDRASDQCHSALAAAGEVEALRTAFGSCTQELRSWGALAGRQGDFLHRLVVSLQLRLRQS